MFALPRHLYASPYQSHYSPYEQLLLEQELERQRRAEIYRRRQLEIEQLKRRRQYEYARRQAELRRQQAEMEVGQETRRRARAECASECRRSMLGGGMEDLFDMLYGGRARSTPQDQRSSFSERGASPGSPARSEGTGTAAEDRVLTAEDTSLSAESTEQTNDSSTALPAEPEPESMGTDETHQPDTAGSHTAVAGILTTFASLSSNLTFPSQLDFSSPPSSDLPKLAYTQNNAPLHQYEHVLTGLLTQLDAVESYGDEEVRKARKEAVTRIEKELVALDERKMEEWRKQSAPEMEVGVEQQTEDEVPTVEVDAARIPLPEDSSDEDGQMAAVGSGLPAAPLSSMHSLSPRTPAPHEHAQISQTSLGEASSSDDSDSEVEDYVDVEVDVVSAAETEETDEAEVEQERDLVGLDEWEMDL